MKKCFFILLMVLSLSLLVFAHPGRTDDNGGHYNQSTGEYHYHHGHPAHQHENGQCPYDFDDQTDHRSGSMPSSETLPTSSRNDISPWVSVLQAFGLGALLPCIVTGPGALLYLLGSFREPEPLREFRDRFITAIKTCFVISAIGGILLSAYIGIPLLWEYLRNTIVGKIALSAYDVLGGGLILLGVGGSLLLIVFIIVPAIISGISSKFKK